LRVVGWGLRVDSDLAIETAEKNPSPPTPLPEAGRGEMEMDGVVASGGSLASGRTRQPGSKKPPECLRTTANIKTKQPPVKTGTTNPNSHPRTRAATGNIRPEFLSAKHSQNVSRDARASGWKRVRHGDVCLSSDPSACALRLTLKPSSRRLKPGRRTRTATRGLAPLRVKKNQRPGASFYFGPYIPYPFPDFPTQEFQRKSRFPGLASELLLRP
jgi:hypothetical protein